MQEKLHEECGVFGIYDNDNLDVVTSTYLALYALQHRGQESCGIAVNDDGVIRSYRDLGLVTDVFKPQVLEKLGSGKMAIGHCLYGTAESDKRDQMAIANNGVVLNAYELRQKLELQGAIFHSTSDAELIAHMITRERLTASSIEEAICNAMDKLYGTYSMLVMSPKKLIGVRDPLGMRPLSIGKMRKQLCAGFRNRRAGQHGRSFRPGCEARRDRHHRRKRPAQHRKALRQKEPSVRL